jgi:hypothetical protein
MMPGRHLLGRAQPLLGIILIAAGWSLSHQFGSNAVFDGCQDRGGGFVVLVSVLGLALAALGAFLCLGGARGSKSSGQHFLGLVGALLALLAGFAILLQLAAGLILPSCAA